jgi:hypothetical protein
MHQLGMGVLIKFFFIGIDIKLIRSFVGPG